MATSSTFLASDGDGYERLMGRWSRRLAPKFIAFADIKDAGNVLDVGCGTGSLTATLATRPGFSALHGIDFSPAYVEHAKRSVTDDRIHFQVADACALPFANGTFDHALAMLVLQFIPQAEAAISEMCRVTRPGGTVAAATWDQRGGVVWARMFWDTAAALDPTAIERRAKACIRPMSLPGDLERAWTAAGLSDVVQDTLSIRMDYASFDDYWTPLAGKDGPFSEYLHSLEPSLLAVLRDKVRLAYLDGEGDGPRSYASTAWVVKGKVPG